MNPHPGNKEIHYNEMAHTSQHYENMKYFMRSKIFMFCIEDRQLQCVDNTSDGIDDAAGQEPAEPCAGQAVEDRNEGQNTEPAHSDVDHRREPFRAVDPAALKDHSDDSNSPYKCTEDIAGAAVKDDKAYRSIAACDHDEDHHVIHFFQTAVYFSGGVYGMIKSAGQIKKDHGQDENTHCKNMKHISTSGSFHDQRSGSGSCKKHGDSVCNRASRVF